MEGVPRPIEEWADGWQILAFGVTHFDWKNGKTWATKAKTDFVSVYSLLLLLFPPFIMFRYVGTQTLLLLLPKGIGTEIKLENFKEFMVGLFGIRQCNMPRRWWPTSYKHYFLIGAWSKYWLYCSPPFWWNLLSHSSLEMVLLEWQSRLKIDIEAAILGAHQTYFFNACGMCPFSPYFYPKKLWQILNI